MIKQFILLILLISFKVTIAQETFEYIDKAYLETIKTVQLYPAGDSRNQLRNPVIALQSNQQLILEFDELYEDAYDYQARIIHCNHDWQPSGLSALQYLDDYNEFNLTEMEYSFGTITPYVHYKFRVPKTKISGNYLLVVFPRDYPDEVILTRRFMVYEKWVSISSAAEIQNQSVQSIDRQNIQFSINYNNNQIINPIQTIAVNIMQNHRWDNLKINVKPTFNHTSQGILEYNNFAPQDGFLAGNEFRRFDMRSLKYFGFHVDGVKFEKKIVNAWIEEDKTRFDLAYAFEDNYNGQFLIENIERKVPEIENDYAKVTFRIKSEKISGQVHLSGKFTDWQFNTESKLEYNASWGGYQGSFLLKQGEYDYQYVVTNTSNPNKIEGNKSETRNIYEIFVYYRSLQLQADLLIGYMAFKYNQL